MEGLRTPHGVLSYALREDHGSLRLHVDAGAGPPGGFVLPWPYDARIDGKPASWHDGELHVERAPLDAVIAAPRMH